MTSSSRREGYSTSNSLWFHPSFPPVSAMRTRARRSDCPSRSSASRRDARVCSSQISVAVVRFSPKLCQNHCHCSASVSAGSSAPSGGLYRVGCAMWWYRPGRRIRSSSCSEGA